MGARQEFLDRLAIVVLVRRINVQEKSIIGDSIEPGIREYGITEPGQLIQENHSKKRGERREQNRQFKGDRNRRGSDTEWLCRNKILVIDTVGPPLH